MADKREQSERALLRDVLDHFGDHGWKDHGGAALAVVDVFCNHKPTEGRLRVRLPSVFLVRNGITRAGAAAILWQHFGEATRG